MVGDGGRIRVVVVDDQVLIRAGLVALLGGVPEIEVVGQAASGAEAVALARTHQPDVVLMDIRMPDTDGIAATRQILATNAENPPRILVLTTFDVDEYVYDALQAGAHGFLLKTTPPERLIAAIATVAAGDKLFAPTVIQRLIEAYVHRRATKVPGLRAELDDLTARELDVLRLVGTGRSNLEIASALTITEATVKTHLNRLMAKLGVASRAQAVVLAYEAGLVRPSPNPAG
jgi:DNA-binding NarL/FixJ family response regulator